MTNSPVYFLDLPDGTEMQRELPDGTLEFVLWEDIREECIENARRDLQENDDGTDDRIACD